MKTTILFFAAIFAIAFCSLPASSQTVRQTNLSIDDGSGHFLNFVLAGLVGSGQSITFPNISGNAALTTDITGGTLAGSFTTLTASPSLSEVGLTISNTGTGNDITGNSWFVDHSGNASFPQLNTGDAEITGGSISGVSIAYASISSLDQIISSQASPPTLSTNDPANISNLTLSPTSTNVAGMFSFSTNGNVLPLGEANDYVQLTFNGITTHNPVVMITPVNDNAANEVAGLFYVATGGTPGYFQMIVGSDWADFGSDPSPLAVYSYYYVVIDTQ